MPQFSNGKLTGWLRSAERSAASVISMSCRACSWQKGCQVPFSRIKELVNTFSQLMSADFPLKNPKLFH
jgi:hypothetical protein